LRYIAICHNRSMGRIWPGGAQVPVDSQYYQAE
jgi:hypothetical protein